MTEENDRDQYDGMLRVVNWDKWQTFRKDRGNPDWIKVHRCVMTSEQWAHLTDAEKGQLISLWIIAADRDGHIPSDSQVLRKLAQLDENPNVKKFIDLGLLEGDWLPGGNQVVTSRLPGGDHVVTSRLPGGDHVVGNLTPQSREEKSREDYIVSTEDSTYSRKSEDDLRNRDEWRAWFAHDFWPTYPKKRSKAQAQRAIDALKPNAELRSRILQGLASAMQSADWQRDGGQYIPYAATWIRAEGWTDEYDIDMPTVHESPVARHNRAVLEQLKRERAAAGVTIDLEPDSHAKH